MPYNLLLLPLLGGYIFITKTYIFRYFTQRADGYRILFHGAMAGAVLMLVASAMVEFLLWSVDQTSWAGTIAQWIGSLMHAIAPFEYSGRTALAFLMGSLGWWPINRLADWSAGRWERATHLKSIWKRLAWASQSQQARRVIYDKGDALETMLNNALETQQPVMFTMKNGKVYVGMLVKNFNPAFPLENIAFFPLRSGYRKEDDRKRVEFTVFYGEAVDEAKQKVAEAQRKAKELLPHASEEEISALIAKHYPQGVLFEFVVPRTEVQSVCYFDPAVYDEHFNRPRTTGPLPESAIVASEAAPGVYPALVFIGAGNPPQQIASGAFEAKSQEPSD